MIQMDSNLCIDQKGIIEEVGNHMVYVKIMPDTGCTNCSVKSVCSAGTRQTTIEIAGIDESYSVGEEVSVTISNGLGFRAVFFGYVLPFIIVIATLCFSSLLKAGELISGVASVSVLIPYYFALYQLRERVKRKFTFSIAKIRLQ